MSISKDTIVDALRLRYDSYSAETIFQMACQRAELEGKTTFEGRELAAFRTALEKVGDRVGGVLARLDDLMGGAPAPVKDAKSGNAAPAEVKDTKSGGSKPNEAKAETKPDAKAEAKPEAKPEPKAEAKPDAKAEAKPEAKPEAKAEAKPETKPDAKPETKPEAKPDAKPEAAGPKN